jgi:hypothetical protein
MLQQTSASRKHAKRSLSGSSKPVSPGLDSLLNQCLSLTTACGIKVFSLSKRISRSGRERDPAISEVAVGHL